MPGFPTLSGSPEKSWRKSRSQKNGEASRGETTRRAARGQGEALRSDAVGAWEVSVMGYFPIKNFPHTEPEEAPTPTVAWAFFTFSFCATP